MPESNNAKGKHFLFGKLLFVCLFYEVCRLVLSRYQCKTTGHFLYVCVIRDMYSSLTANTACFIKVHNLILALTISGRFFDKKPLKQVIAGEMLVISFLVM